MIELKDNIVVQSEAIELLELFPKENIKLIITDPPYGIAYHSGFYKGKNPHAPINNDWNFQIHAFYQEVENRLAKDGAMYLFTRYDVYPIWAAWLPSTLKIRNCIIWLKNNWSAGDLEGNFGNQYEIILFITKKEHKIRGKRWSNVWEFPRISHNKLRIAAEKPVELIMRAINASSNIGDVIVDPYCGSGSTGDAAIRCNRKYIMGDIDKTMVKVASTRLGIHNASNIPDVEIPECPIMKSTPPEPHLWGLHPEDLLEILNIEKGNQKQIYNSTEC